MDIAEANGLFGTERRTRRNSKASRLRRVKEASTKDQVKATQRKLCSAQSTILRITQSNADKASSQALIPMEEETPSLTARCNLLPYGKHLSRKGNEISRNESRSDQDVQEQSKLILRI